MVSPENFYKWLSQNEINFFSGVPDSLLKDICAYITDNTNKKNHIIAANEGNSIALAAGYHLGTGKVPMVYMQNSGIGNAINPILSLTDEKVYKIPLLLMIGWRGEPGKKDEPQHISQGEVTLDLLKAMGIPFTLLSDDEKEACIQLKNAVNDIKLKGVAHALIIRKGTFSKYKIIESIKSDYEMSREEAVQLIVGKFIGDEVVISTTGKTSRELFEVRESLKQPHFSDFLTVGSMGHSSQIALGVALSNPNRKVVCLDGDGAVIMHMGSLAINGDISPSNFIHIVINNGSHESVGGQPTVGFNIDIPNIALNAGYKSSVSVSSETDLINALQDIQGMDCPMLIEVKVKVGSRDDLGRPTIKPVDNKNDFMKFVADGSK